MPTQYAYTVGMKKTQQDQYTIRNIPASIDKSLRRQAKETGKSLNEILLAALHRGSGIDTDTVAHTDLDFLIGTWEEDAAVGEALQAQRQIDKSLWS